MSAQLNRMLSRKRTIDREKTGETNWGRIETHLPSRGHLTVVGRETPVVCNHGRDREASPSVPNRGGEHCRKRELSESSVQITPATRRSRDRNREGAMSCHVLPTPTGLLHKLPHLLERGRARRTPRAIVPR